MTDATTRLLKTAMQAQPTLKARVEAFIKPIRDSENRLVSLTLFLYSEEFMSQRAQLVSMLGL